MATIAVALGALLLSKLLLLANCSLGDRLYLYQDCVKNCTEVICSTPESHSLYEVRRPLVHRLTLWKCLDDCKYVCMWETVNQLTVLNQSVPQFHGKWPFVRIWGLQEPASVVFSILNLLAFAHLFVSVWTKIPPAAPMRLVWLCYSGLGIFTWIWSAIFHGRDTLLTERMDYFCAFACVLFSLYACLVRIAGASRWTISLLAVPLLTFYSYHVWYLTRINFDYGYNMKVNVALAVGLCNSVSWLLWSLYMLMRKKVKFVRNCLLVTLLVNLFILLELLDFPPIFWTFDAHSLWHLATVPLPLLWSRFVVEDCRYQLNLHSKSEGRKFE